MQCCSYTMKLVHYALCCLVDRMLWWFAFRRRHRRTRATRSTTSYTCTLLAVLAGRGSALTAPLQLLLASSCFLRERSLRLWCWRHYTKSLSLCISLSLHHYFILLLELIQPTCVQHLMTSGSAVPVIWLEPSEFFNRSYDLTTPLSGTVCRP